MRRRARAGRPASHAGPGRGLYLVPRAPSVLGLGGIDGGDQLEPAGEPDGLVVLGAQAALDRLAGAAELELEAEPVGFHATSLYRWALRRDGDHPVPIP